MKYKVAVVGATGNVGREILRILEDRKFPISEIVALASRESAGRPIHYGDSDKVMTVQALDDYDFTGTHIALFSPGSAISSVYAPKAAAKGAIVIDNTSYFRMNDDIPLVVSEVNPQRIADYKNAGIIANPNCAAMAMLVALKPLHDAARIKRITVTTFQSVSGAGKAAMDELYNQTKAKFIFQEVPAREFPTQIAFNVIPQIDSFEKDGFTKEEMKIQMETKKILEDNEIEVCATCVRVPVFVGHSLSVNVEFENTITPEKAVKILDKSPGIMVLNRLEDDGYATPADCVGQDEVFVSRIRKDATVKNGLAMWIVSDNLRKGAALNAVQIAEELVKTYI